jgi:DNA-binding GntR family transcriptional regulator
VARPAEAALSGIREAILDGAWMPGERLAPPHLAQRFSTSTTVIRESLTRLSGEGLVAAIPNRGFFVPELNLRQLRDQTELRCVTEQLAATLAIERGDLEWESALIAAHYRLSKAPRRQVENPEQFTAQWGKAHRDFHQLLLAPCACPPLLELSANLANSTLLYRRWAAASEAATHRNVEAEHEGLLQAALDRDAGDLGERLRAHYEATAQVILDAGLLKLENS